MSACATQLFGIEHDMGLTSLSLVYGRGQAGLQFIGMTFSSGVHPPACCMLQLTRLI